MASQDLVAIVTGAAQGIGFAISDMLLREGYKVCLADINAEKGVESLAELNKKFAADRIIFAKCDVTSKSSLEEVFTRTQKELGRIDVVINNAGIVDEHDPKAMVEVNLMGTLHGCELALKFVGTKNGGQGGAVVNTGSALGVIPHPNVPAYSATKHAIVGLTRSYGNKMHLEQNGVIFMAVCPYTVETPLHASAKILLPVAPGAFPSAVQPETVAKGVLTLLTDRRNGSILLVLCEGQEYTELDEKLKKITVQ